LDRAASVGIVASARAGRIEVLLGMAQSSSRHSGTQDQQHVSNDGTGYRRFHHIVKPGTQGD
jgi:hypothetical protein